MINNRCYELQTLENSKINRRFKQARAYDSKSSGSIVDQNFSGTLILLRRPSLLIKAI